MRRQVHIGPQWLVAGLGKRAPMSLRARVGAQESVRVGRPHDVHSVACGCSARTHVCVSPAPPAALAAHCCWWEDLLVLQSLCDSATSSKGGSAVPAARVSLPPACARDPASALTKRPCACSASGQVLLSAAAEDPDSPAAALPLMSAAEREQVVVAFNSAHARVESGRSCLHELFQQHAQSQPDAPCLICGDETLAYGEVSRQSRLGSQGLCVLHAVRGTLVVCQCSLI